MYTVGQEVEFITEYMYSRFNPYSGTITKIESRNGRITLYINGKYGVWWITPRIDTDSTDEFMNCTIVTFVQRSSWDKRIDAEADRQWHEMCELNRDKPANYWETLAHIWQQPKGKSMMRWGTSAGKWIDSSILHQLIDNGYMDFVEPQHYLSSGQYIPR